MLKEGRWVHEQTIESCLETDVVVGSSLIAMYAKCGSIEDALRVFYRMPTHNVVSWNAMILVSWNAMILGHVQCVAHIKLGNVYNLESTIKYG
jgi:pentatricopeptide repeat protein